MVQTTGSERVTAAAVNISAIFFPYLGPIVGAVIAGQSKFVRYHAYRCLIEQVVSTVILVTLLLVSFGYTLYGLSKSMAGGFDIHKIDFLTILIKAAVTWVLLGLWEVVNIVLSIRDALEALNGQLPLKPKWTERKAMVLTKL